MIESKDGKILISLNMEKTLYRKLNTESRRHGTDLKTMANAILIKYFDVMDQIEREKHEKAQAQETGPDDSRAEFERWGRN